MDGGGDNGAVGMESLDDNRGMVEVAAADATDDLGEELKGAFGSGVIGEREASVGLNYPNGSETR